MQVVASFTGRGVDTHEIVTTREAVLDGGLIHNLVDGVRTGRVRWFTVLGAGVESPLDERRVQQEWFDAGKPLGPSGFDEIVNTVNALNADGADPQEF